MPAARGRLPLSGPRKPPVTLQPGRATCDHHPERGAVDAELVLMAAFVGGALLLTLLFVQAFGGQIAFAPELQPPQGGVPPARAVPVEAPRTVPGTAIEAGAADAPARGSVLAGAWRALTAAIDLPLPRLPQSAVAETAPVALLVLEPSEGALLPADAVTVRVLAEGILLEGLPGTQVTAPPVGWRPGALRLQLDGGEAVLWESTLPYTFRDVAEGPHLLTIELVDAGERPLEPAVRRQIRFRTSAVAEEPPPDFLPDSGGIAPRAP